MKRRILFFAQVLFLTLFILSLAGTIFQLAGDSSPLTQFDHKKDAAYNGFEAYDPSLSRLNSLRKLEQYCDSIYAEKVFSGSQGDFERTYTDIASNAVRNRFYHGYSYYGFEDNYLAALASKVAMPGLSALVIPDEILKHPFAACSQQSIVMMEVLKDKGFTTRKVTFMGKTYGGHFAFEVFYNNQWHFHDPNLEPDKAILDSYGRPGIAYLAQHPDILVKAYNHLPATEVMDLFPNYAYGEPNKFPATKAVIYHKATKFLSYTLWIFFLLALVIVRRKYLRVINNGRLNSMRMQSVSSSYYPDYKAQGA